MTEENKEQILKTEEYLKKELLEWYKEHRPQLKDFNTIAAYLKALKTYNTRRRNDLRTKDIAAHQAKKQIQNHKLQRRITADEFKEKQKKKIKQKKLKEFVKK